MLGILNMCRLWLSAWTANAKPLNLSEKPCVEEGFWEAKRPFNLTLYGEEKFSFTLTSSFCCVVALQNMMEIRPNSRHGSSLFLLPVFTTAGSSAPPAAPCQMLREGGQVAGPQLISTATTSLHPLQHP